METKIILALGNPGARYRFTRHNIGRIAAEHVLSSQPRNKRCIWEKRKRLWSELCLSSADENRVIYARALTLMNETGKAAAALLHHYRISSRNLLVMHDDSDIEFGKLKYTTESRSAGHHGVESIIESIGTNTFSRIRIGIRPAGNSAKADALVLKPFSKRELETIEKTITPEVQTLVQNWLSGK